MLDTEMSKEDHLNRILSNISGVPIGDISTGKFAEDDEKLIAVRNAMDEIRDIPIHTLALPVLLLRPS